ncbi:PD-(D/E)XK nuclease-like domain-containing protein [Streptococcus mitis]|uniref:PD-(D/E)XK nuclease-like domain-containing protein n=1 Tax=Streptococcus mitis TaxID=28037 RepID=UPI001C4F3EF2|nr:putative exonuclease [Streptococcus phage MismyG]
MTMDLLGKDYYSAASARRYWSISQYKRFRECEARALAELEGEWEDQRDNTALLVGNMVHSYFESPEAHKKFMDENADAMISKAGKTKGQLKADFLVGQCMIERLEADEQFMEYYVGQKEVAVTGEIEGVEFKGKIDCLNVEKGYFVDIKTTKSDIDSMVWVQDEASGRNIQVRWFEAWGYVLQMAAYKKMLKEQYGKEFTPVIYAVTKESTPDTRAIVFQSQEKLDYELSELSMLIKHLDDVKKGKEEAKPCGHCEYCKTKALSQRVEVV